MASDYLFGSSNMKVSGKRQKLRFGIMCEGTNFYQWQADAITQLLANKDIECHLLIIDSQSRLSKKFRYLRRRARLKNILWLAFGMYCQVVSRANKKVSLEDLLKDIPTIKCRVSTKGKYSQYFSEQDVLEINNHRLDFILKFGFGIIRGEILKAAKYGVWSFHHGDEQQYRGGPPGFWEICKKETVTGAILQRLTNKLDAGVVLKKGFLKTKLSYVRNRDQMFFTSSIWPVQVCVDILCDQVDYLSHPPSTTTAPIYRAPSNLQFIKFVIQHNYRKILSLIRPLLWAGYWNIGVIDQPIHRLLHEDNYKTTYWFPGNFRGKYLADPFALAERNKLHVFFEEFVYREKLGKISYSCFESGQYSQPTSVIQEPFHLSYPYLFKYQGNYFIVPESFQIDQVVLYKAYDFPLKWKKERVLLDNFAGLDNTIYKYNGIWWLFSSIRNEGENSHLYLFYADNPLANWKSHPQNPVKIDVRSARPAGPLFQNQGKLYRPAMDCSETYGGGVVVNQVLKLTKTEYREVEYTRIRELKDTAFADKIHTICPAGKFTLVDGFKESFIATDFNSFNYVLYKVARIINVKLLGGD
jgi:hypothetical protein